MKKYTYIYNIAFFTFLCTCPTATQQKNKMPEKKSQTNFEKTIYNWMGTFAEVLQKTEQKHYKIAQAEECMIQAINGFMSCLDPHSSFLDPKTYKYLLEDTSGKFFGIGIIIDNTRREKDKFLLIVDTLPDGPAQKAGVQRLDKIVEINGKSLEGMSTEKATSLLKGQKDTTVHIKILRENHPDILSYDITRDIIKEKHSLCFYLPEHNVYYLALTMFSDSAIQQMEQLLTKTQEKPCKGLIIDLRNNTGGLLNAAIDIAGLFLKKGSFVVGTKNNKGQISEQFVTNREPIANNSIPIFILINNYTGSAAEILAGCLKLYSEKDPHLNVFLTGSNTFGKGSVQEVIPVSNNCAMRVTISLYFLLNETPIQGLGIKPDFLIEQRMPPTDQMVWFSKFYGRESALPNYIKDGPEEKIEDEKASEPSEEQNEKKDTKSSWLEQTKKSLQKDNQLRQTIGLINLYDSAKKYCPNLVSSRSEATQFMQNIFVSGEKMEFISIEI